MCASASTQNWLVRPRKAKEDVKKIAERTQIIETGVEELVNARKVANKIENEHDKAIAYHDTVAPKMEKNVTCYFCYFCYRLISFLPLNAFLPSRDSGQG